MRTSCCTVQKNLQVRGQQYHDILCNIRSVVAIGIGILFITLYIVTPEWHLTNELQYFYELDQKYDFSTEEYQYVDKFINYLYADTTA